jgi:hypothetical protein
MRQELFADKSFNQCLPGILTLAGGKAFSGKLQGLNLLGGQANPDFERQFGHFIPDNPIGSVMATDGPCFQV